MSIPEEEVKIKIVAFHAPLTHASESQQEDVVSFCHYILIIYAQRKFKNSYLSYQLDLSLPLLLIYLEPFLDSWWICWKEFDILVISQINDARSEVKVRMQKEIPKRPQFFNVINVRQQRRALHEKMRGREMEKFQEFSTRFAKIPCKFHEFKITCIFAYTYIILMCCNWNVHERIENTFLPFFFYNAFDCRLMWCDVYYYSSFPSALSPFLFFYFACLMNNSSLS